MLRYTQHAADLAIFLPKPTSETKVKIAPKIQKFKLVKTFQQCRSSTEPVQMVRGSFEPYCNITFSQPHFISTPWT